ncbi:MAG: ureidoglycolate lyase [Planctomycetota bacterium]
MRTTPIEELSRDAFAPFGEFADLIDPDAIVIGAPPIQFFRDMVPLNLGGHGIASFSVCRVEDRPAVVDVTEYHTACGEGILPLDADVLIHVAIATPNGEVPHDRVRLFRVPKGTFVALKPGVWHHAPILHDQNARAANVVIVLPERTYANDCIVEELPADQQTQAG